MKKRSLMDPVGRVRVLGLVEGVSFLLLLGVAMPLKRLAGIPEAVTYIGWAHGVLFILLGLAVMQAWLEKALSFKQSALVMVAALLPFGPFVMDRRLESPGAGG